MLVVIGKTPFVDDFEGRRVSLRFPEELDDLVGVVDAVIFSEDFIQSNVHLNPEDPDVSEGIAFVLEAYLKARSYTENLYSFKSGVNIVDSSFKDILKGKWFDYEAFEPDTVVGINDSRMGDTLSKSIDLILVILKKIKEGGAGGLPAEKAVEEEEPLKESDILTRKPARVVPYNVNVVNEHSLSVLHIKEIGSVPMLTSFVLGMHRWRSEKEQDRCRLIMILPNTDIAKARYSELYYQNPGKVAWVDSTARSTVRDHHTIILLFTPLESIIKPIFLGTFFSKYIILDRLQTSTEMHIEVKCHNNKKVLAFPTLFEASKMLQSESLDLSRVRRGVLVAESDSDGPKDGSRPGYYRDLPNVNPDWLRIPRRKSYPVTNQRRFLVYNQEDMVQLYQSPALNI